MQHLQFSVCLFIETTMSVSQCFCDVYELLDSGFKVERTPKTVRNYFISNQTTLNLTRLSKTLISSDSADCAMYYCVYTKIWFDFAVCFHRTGVFCVETFTVHFWNYPKEVRTTKNTLFVTNSHVCIFPKISWKSNLYTYGFKSVFHWIWV